MQTVQKYVLEPVKTGGLDDQTVAEVLEVLQAVFDSVYEVDKFSAVVNIMLAEKFGDYVYTGVAGMGKNIFIVISDVVMPREVMPREAVMPRGARALIGLGDWYDEIKKYDLMVKANFQGVRSLQDLAAHQMACSIRNSPVSLEQLPIPSLTKKVVGKFVETANMITCFTYENTY
eukprot:GFUD01064473.1.p1 GENE.GFUD01064473.1~~GFUD01064473.1.p1  ORF type:complete len:175 (-),score=43.52 GFUD01064473.1:91-615(-)